MKQLERNVISKKMLKYIECYRMCNKLVEWLPLQLYTLVYNTLLSGNPRMRRATKLIQVCELLNLFRYAGDINHLKGTGSLALHAVPLPM